MNLDEDRAPYGVISSISGAVSMVAWLIPIVGAMSSFAALYFGSRVIIDDQEDGWAIAGVSLGATALLLTVVRSGLVYYYG